MLSKQIRLTALAILLLAISSRGAVIGNTGLEAVAVRSDGKFVAVGGQNRVVYLVDAAAMTVKKRFWLVARVGAVAFSPDGSRLVVEDDADRVHLLDADTGKVIAKLDGLSGMAVSRKAGLIALYDTLKVEKTGLRLLSLADLTDKGRIALPEQPAAYTFDAEGKRIVVLSRSVAGDEERLPLADAPAHLKGLARTEFQQKHDGYQSYLRTFDVGSGKMLREVKLWYTSDSDSTLLVQAGEITYVYNRSNVCARIAADGATTLFQTVHRFNHGLGASENGKYILTGSLAEGSQGPSEGGRRVRFEVDVLPGQAEFFTRCAVRDDGSAFGVTTAFRLVKITREGRVEKAAPVY